LSKRRELKQIKKGMKLAKKGMKRRMTPTFGDR
jgi:hypothetical protein